ncbi:zinc finger BED domain-containing protein RICESLEEPER 2-like [Phalaenopsis equestris]|uniref:zinc finger BED domain-containing protein RICESLEEPER 2-like n=1 Tax=Phalaenopsis equestris TaxID=78828 RepID=UPI0009E3DF83|nr:zinc finger BED domain-containing protein RICESLEEPER 2-like [Phalaenopsis equestris]
MESIIKKHEEIFGGRNLLLNNTEKSVVNILHSYLEPFHKITSNLSACRVSTIGLVLFFMDHVFELISACRDAGRHDWLKIIADDMAKRARSFSSQGYNLFTYMAAVLDPRIKKELIPEKLNSEKNLEEARTHFTRHYATSQLPSMANGFSSHDPDEDDAVSFAEEIARKRRRLSANTATDELSQYLSEPPAPIATDVFEWWKVNSSRYPRLSAMARDYLAAQGTSVDPDELFSSRGDRIRKQQFCSSYGVMQAGMCVDSWSRSGFKFKFKSSEIKFEKEGENSLAA